MKKKNCTKKIIVAEAQGFCMGVRKALVCVNKYDSVKILGDLIHNKQVVKKLEQENKEVIKEVKGDEKVPVVITAHGTRLENIHRIENLGLELIDTTCPLVSVIYKKGIELEKEGYHILIIGDSQHIEVQGIASRMYKPIIIENEEELNGLELPKKVGIISQSTYSSVKFEKLVNLIKEKVTEVKVKNTICAPTVKRQKAAEELAQKVDIMIVIGGYHSSNTKKLAVLSRQYVTTYHIETADELKEEWFKGTKLIGITAGASTPDWIIEEVRAKIANFNN